MNRNQMHGNDEPTATILLVEDEGNLRILLGKQLRHIGYHVIEAEDGAAALDCFTQQSDNINLLITDIMMPRMNGIELAKKIREKNLDLPILFISGYMNGADLNLEPPENHNYYLQKPFTLKTLAQKVETILGLSG